MRADTATAIILAGGTGYRMGDCAVPKQFLQIRGKPILIYAMEVFDDCPLIDRLLVVVSEEWRNQVEKWMGEFGFCKPVLFANPGSSRQGSIHNALKNLEGVLSNDSAVMIHDAVRPLVEPELILRVLYGLETAEGCMPALPLTDTTYLSQDGVFISALLRRSELFAGQTPEAYNFGPYLKAHDEASKEEIDKIHGSSEMAVRHGLKVKIVEGSYNNRKLTVQEDLEYIQQALEQM